MTELVWSEPYNMGITFYDLMEIDGDVQHVLAWIYISRNGSITGTMSSRYFGHTYDFVKYGPNTDINVVKDEILKALS